MKNTSKIKNLVMSCLSSSEKNNDDYEETDEMI